MVWSKSIQIDKMVNVLRPEDSYSRFEYRALSAGLYLPNANILSVVRGFGGVF